MGDQSNEMCRYYFNSENAVESFIECLSDLIKDSLIAHSPRMYYITEHEWFCCVHAAPEVHAMLFLQFNDICTSIRKVI